jgi:hypothetical protein
MKSAKAKADILSSDLKSLAIEKWLLKYEEEDKNPGSVMLEQMNELDETAQFMFVPSDKYLKIGKEDAEQLKEDFGDDIVEESTKYSFDDKMIKKYGEVLSKLILESDEIADADKRKIIKATNTYSIKKGTIDKLSDYGDVDEIFETVRPVVSLKGVEVVNG